MIKLIATIGIIGLTTISCTSRKAVRTVSCDAANQELTMLVGTYTSGESKGIYSFRFDEESGTATPLSEAEVKNPSYLTPSADGKFVYAVSELGNEQAAAYAFAFDKEKGTFSRLNSQPT
ncbi:beta-propeller fold lactonase family protein, partial [uncultured Bacteroides sp.]